MMGGRIGQQGRDALLPYSPEALHPPVQSRCKCLDAQELTGFRNYVIKVRGCRIHTLEDGCAGFLLGEVFHWLEVRNERQGEARHA